MRDSGSDIANQTNMANQRAFLAMQMPKGRSRVLLVFLAVYIILDILLTPPAGLETRPPGLVTSVGLITLGLLFTGLALSILSIILLCYKPRVAPRLAIIVGILFLPAFIAEQGGYFSSLRPPVAIETVEIVQTLIALILIVVGFSIHRQRAS